MAETVPGGRYQGQDGNLYDCWGKLIAGSVMVAEPSPAPEPPAALVPKVETAPEPEPQAVEATKPPAKKSSRAKK